MRKKESEVRIDIIDDIVMDEVWEDEQRAFYASVIIRILELYKQKLEETE